MKKSNLKIITIVGTRPEIIRLSEVIKRLENYFDHKLVFTNQNFSPELSNIFFKDLKIKNLEIYFDSPVTLAKTFSLRGIPTSILFNKKGEEFARIIGSINFEDKKFIEWLANYN